MCIQEKPSGGRRTQCPCNLFRFLHRSVRGTIRTLGWVHGFERLRGKRSPPSASTRLSELYWLQPGLPLRCRRLVSVDTYSIHSFQSPFRACFQIKIPQPRFPAVSVRLWRAGADYVMWRSKSDLVFICVPTWSAFFGSAVHRRFRSARSKVGHPGGALKEHVSCGAPL